LKSLWSPLDHPNYIKKIHYKNTKTPLIMNEILFFRDNLVIINCIKSWKYQNTLSFNFKKINFKGNEIILFCIKIWKNGSISIWLMYPRENRKAPPITGYTCSFEMGKTLEKHCGVFCPHVLYFLLILILIQILTH
jgi:hypothetical protein